MTVTLDDVADQIVDVSEELAKALGYNEWREGELATHPLSKGYYVQTGTPNPPRVSDPKIVQMPRAVLVRGDGWMADFIVDSTYEIWYIYTRGTTTGPFVDKVLPCLEWEDGIWPKLKQAWIDLCKNRGLNTSGGMSPQTPYSQPANGSTPNSSAKTNSQKTPKFGDLASGSKPSTRKIKAQDRYSSS